MKMKKETIEYFIHVLVEKPDKLTTSLRSKVTIDSGAK